MSQGEGQVLCLTPRQNQDFRLHHAPPSPLKDGEESPVLLTTRPSPVLRVCQRSLVAIEGYGCPLVSELIPLHATSPALLDALLALAGQVRARLLKGQPLGADPGAADDYPGLAPMDDAYHQALVNVRALVEHQDVVDGSQDVLLAAIAGAIILVFLSMAGPDHDWQHHAQQITHLIDCADLALFSCSSLGRLLLMSAAHLDTPAGSLGRSTPSTSAWSRWGIDDLPRPPDEPFSEFEIIVGQPSSLTSLIARVGHCAESRRAQVATLDSVPSSNDAGRGAADWHYVKTLIDFWEPPAFPPDFPGHQRLVLLTAWRITIRATRLYHLRQLGFYSDLGQPIAGISTESYVATLQDMAVGIRFLLDDFKSNNTTMANAMAWPLAVLGSECGSNSTCHLQRDVVRLIQDVSETFLMSHLHHLLLILQDLWEEQMLPTNSDKGGSLSLESITRKHGLSVPLL
ncbi:hypothetical protein Neosp_014186 [[Neocosmospora] mangrovei]